MTVDRATVVTVPTLVTRHHVRRISEHLSDLEGVVALTVDVQARTVTVDGYVTVEDVQAAIAAAGHEVGQASAPTV